MTKDCDVDIKSDYPGEIKAETTNPGKCASCPEMDCPEHPEYKQPEPDPQAVTTREAWETRLRPEIEAAIASGEVKGMTIMLVKGNGYKEIGYIDPNARRKVYGHLMLQELDKMIPTPDEVAHAFKRTADELFDLLASIQGLK